MGGQLRLDLRGRRAFSRQTFVVSACNAEAVARVDAWPRWTVPVLALIGPEGSGKTHLARGWAERSGAAVASLADESTVPDGPLLIEDVDRTVLDERLFHAMNRASDPAHSLMLTARTLPTLWSNALPDLRSRLNALPAVEIGEPDDGVLQGAFRALFAERAYTPSPELIAYLVARTERSVPAARALVERLEAASVAQDRPINRALARTLFTEPELPFDAGELDDAE